jgi:hypothetical protein
MINLLQAIAEPSSAILCFILAWFMIKPYRLTGEASFLGLPLGFGIMGIGHVIATIAAFSYEVSWFMLLFRTFSFVFLAMTYLFSGKFSRTHQQFWNITLSMLVVALIVLSLIFVVTPQPFGDYYNIASIYYRIFIGICLLFIVAHTLRTHLKKPDPNTLWIPLGFILLAISQYSFILFYVSESSPAAWGGLVFRFAGLIMFLLVSWRTFFSEKEFG